MDLRDLLGEALFNQIKSKLPEGKELIINDGSYISRSRFNEINEQAKGYKSKIESYEKQINETSEMLNSSKELKSEYERLQGKYKADLEAKDKEISNVLKSSLIKESLIKEGAKHVDLLMKQIDLDKLSIDNGNLIGAQDTVKVLKETYKDMFTVTKVEGTQSGGGQQKQEDSGSSNPFSKFL